MSKKWRSSKVYSFPALFSTEYSQNLTNRTNLYFRKINSSSSSTASTSMEEARRIFEKFKKDYEEHEKFSTSLTDTFNNVSDGSITIFTWVYLMSSKYLFWSQLFQLNEATLKRSENIETYMKSMTNRTSHYFKVKIIICIVEICCRREKWNSNVKSRSFVILLQTLMALRDFNGKLQFDHEKQTLVLDVITRDKSQVNATSGTKLLSGGERSYTMNILLRSLWMCMDHPFYFLDEYDIFTVIRMRFMFTFDIQSTDCISVNSNIFLLLKNTPRIKWFGNISLTFCWNNQKHIRILSTHFWHHKMSPTWRYRTNCPLYGRFWKF